jgi:hypothetical protein
MGGPKHPKVGSQNALLQGRSLWKTLLKFENKEKHPWSDREGNRGGRDYMMHEKKNTER